MHVRVTAWASTRLALRRDCRCREVVVACSMCSIVSTRFLLARAFGCTNSPAALLSAGALAGTGHLAGGGYIGTSGQ